MRRSDAAAVLVAALVLCASALPGCTPRCQEVCSKVLDCGLESSRVARDECVLSCQQEEALYQVWEDDTKAAAFRDHKRCIRGATCDELAAGECYDELLFVLDPVSPAG